MKGDAAGRTTGRPGTAARRTRLVGVAALCLALAASAQAHDVVVDQVVEASVRPQAGALSVHLHVPLGAVAGAQLPRRDDGTLDAFAAAGQLEVVGADIARNLDVWEKGTPLPVPRVSTAVGADGQSLDVDLTYAIGNAAGPFSARLNAFTGTPLAPVRTDVRYTPASGREQSMTVRGQPVRVTFAPALSSVLADFAARSLRSVLGAGDPLLFLACLLLPMRRFPAAAELYVAMLAGQTAAFLAGAVALSGSPAALPAVALVGSSALVIAALQAIVQARRAWTLTLALAFGVFSGLLFAAAFVPARQFAGAHAAAAAATFLAVVLAGELWLGALGWGVRVWLDGVGTPERMFTFVAGALIVHTAIDRMSAHAAELEAATGFGAIEAIAWLTVAWTLIVVLAALAEAWRHWSGRRVPPDLAGQARA